METIFPEALLKRAEALIAVCRELGLTLATAESCTGGLLAGLLTEVSGSSAVLDRGFVTYSNAAKRTLLGIPDVTLERFGAVSVETAEAMARGALSNSDASIAVSITGIAGPGGGTEEKPVGLVCFGLALRNGGCRTIQRLFGDLGRGAVRMESVGQALSLLEEVTADQDV